MGYREEQDQTVETTVLHRALRTHGAEASVVQRTVQRTVACGAGAPPPGRAAARTSRMAAS